MKVKDYEKMSKVEITKIMVQGNSIVVHKTETRPLGLIFEKEEMKRFDWLGKDFTIVLPTFAGYGLAWNTEKQKWVPIDIKERKINEYETKEYDAIPSDCIQGMVVSEDEWGSWALKIPVENKTGVKIEEIPAKLEA